MYSIVVVSACSVVHQHFMERIILFTKYHETGCTGVAVFNPLVQCSYQKDNSRSLSACGGAFSHKARLTVDGQKLQK